MPAASDQADTLAIYTRDVAKYPVLTREQEREFGVRAQNGDVDAREKLVIHNLRFVIKIAKKYAEYGLPIMDLIQAGNMGLQHAANKFDPERKVRFISYAVHWIRQYIQKEIDGNHESVRPTKTQMVRLRRVRKMQENARNELGRELSTNELVDRTGYTSARVEEAQNFKVTIQSLDSPVGGDDGSGLTLAHILGGDDTTSEREHEAEVRQIIARVMDEVLLPRERRVLIEYFGFEGAREMSLTDIGISLGVTRERVRQLKERALKKIRNSPEYREQIREVFVTKQDMDDRKIARQQQEEEEELERRHGMGRGVNARDEAGQGRTTGSAAGGVVRVKKTPKSSKGPGTPKAEGVRQTALGRSEAKMADIEDFGNVAVPARD